MSKINRETIKADPGNLMYGRVPPQDKEAEEAVLGALMVEADKIDDVITILPDSNTFYVDAHRKVYDAILRLNTKGSPVDIITVSQEVGKANELEMIGGAWFITQLTSNVVTSANVEAHARIIKEKFIQRELIRISGQTIGDAYDNMADAFEVLEVAEKSIYELSSGIVAQDVKHVSEISLKTTKEIAEQRERAENFTGVSTGYTELDKITSGWQPTALYILAARPAVGKTAFTLNLGLNAAKSGKPTAIFSLEMSAGQLVKRNYSNLGSIDMEYWRHPKNMPPEMFSGLCNKVMPQLSSLPMFVDDTPALSTTELRAKARKLKRKHGIELIIIDYLQLMKGERQRNGNREQEIAGISRDLKVIAKELNLAIVALSQLNRGIEDRADGVPKLRDLRESGAIEQDADSVMFLYAPTLLEIAKDATLQNRIHLEVAKNRDGECKGMSFEFHKQFQRFTEYKYDPFGGMPQMTPQDIPNPRAGITPDYDRFNQDNPF